MGEEKWQRFHFDLSPESKAWLKKHKIPLRKDPRKRGKKKYSKGPQYVYFNEGYDVLENFSLARHFIQRKYEIDYRLLEILLYLYPKNYFTWGEYYEFPKGFQYLRMRKMIAEGIISVAVPGKGERSSLYTLSKKHKLVVTNFYAYLFGEKKIPEMASPLNKVGASEIDKQRHKLIKKINGIPPSDNKKRFFE